MLKQTFFYLSAIVLAWQVFACKNNTVEKQTAEPETSTTLPAERTDSLVGFKGCNRAGFSAISAVKCVFKYQDLTITTTNKEQGGALIEILNNSSGYRLKIPDAEPTYFRGTARGHIFIDIGANPDVRELIIYRLNSNKLSQMYRMSYFVSDPPFVSENGGFWFYTPVEESAVSNVPDCPEKADWLKKDLKIGYGQRHIYNLIQRGLTRKSEFICAPLQ